ncbi:MAG TPA: hypothetical protein VME22_04640 [Solirubrobacteraceae bacterium]|nr:hypothetical protein [Solirubrobacteraceae bacterium]
MSLDTEPLAVDVEPAEVGFDAARLAQLDAYLDECVAQDLHKGSLLALARGKHIPPFVAGLPRR